MIRKVQPGSYVELRAEMDVLPVLSNCPQANNPGTLHRLSGLRVFLEAGLCDGLQLGKFVALPHPCERGGLKHRLDDRPGERSTKSPRRQAVRDLVKLLSVVW